MLDLTVTFIGIYTLCKKGLKVLKNTTMPHKIQKVNKTIKFKNVHGNYFEPFSAIIRLYNDEHKSTLDSYKSTSESIREIIQYAIDNDIRTRACGSLWSMSKVPYVKGAHIFTYDEEDEPSCNIKFFLESTDKRAAVKNNSYLFAQCGNTIKELNSYCSENELSLKTMGASNGQTIAGAIGTGVHGSSIKVGSIQDPVAALHIIKGPHKKDSILIQPKSHQIITKRFAAKIGAELIEDDDLFSAALVGLGSFGYVHGVIIETEPKFYLTNYVKETSLEKAFIYSKTLSLNNTGLAVRGMPIENLFHVKFYINQYDGTTRAEIIYKTTGKPKGRPKFLKYNKDFTLGIVRFITGIAPGAISSQINKRLPTPGKFETGILGEIFGDTTNMRDGQFACALAVDSKNTEVIYNIMTKPFKSKNKKRIPSAFSFRFVPKSKAMLAFTKYEMNCIIEIDGIETKPTKKYLEYIHQKLIESNIPHTWHWGKFNLMDNNFVKKMYNSDRIKWIKTRTKFLQPKVAQIFSNEYIHKRGLS